MKTLKIAILGLVAALVMGVFTVTATPVQAQTNLGDLIVLNGLFGGGGDFGDLAGLIAIENVTGDGSGLGGDTSLTDLIVLNGLFGDGGGFGGDGLSGLAGLIAVENLFNDGI